MTTRINLPAIYIADMMAIVLTVMVYMGNRWRIVNDKTEELCVKIMMGIVVMACAVDAMAFSCDGVPGMLGFVGTYVGNFMLFFTNMLIGPAWVTLVIHHVRGSLRKYEIRLMIIVSIFGVGFLIANFFTPLVFHIDENNVYYRDALYWFYIVLEIGYILYGSISYYLARKRGGVLKFFPVIQFIVPMLIGMGIQTAFYGVSTIVPFVSISIFCMISSLQNENVYRDALTGFYNRAFLDNVKTEMERRGNGVVTAVMIDMNDFKGINDRFGHKVGDEALVAMAKLMRDAVAEFGSVIRYAGDEFVVLLNTHEEEEIEAHIEALRNNVENYNRTSGKEYKISFAAGYCSIDLAIGTIDELLNEIDRRMYEDKAQYYQNHPMIDRRQRR